MNSFREDYMVREANVQSLEDILSLYRQLFPEEEYSDSSAFNATWSEIVNNKNIKCFIAYHDTMPVSTCIITVIPNLTRNQRPYALIENVVTRSEYRGMGFGRAVMEGAVEYAKEKNCYKVMLLSDSSRTEAHKFYEILGFDGSVKIGFTMKLQ